MIAVEILIAMSAVAMCGLFTLHASESARRARNHARDAAAFARRGAEHGAAYPLEVDRGTVAAVRPLRLVHLHECDEQLVDAAVRRHPQMSPRDEETVPPAQADPLPALGCASKP